MDARRFILTLIVVIGLVLNVIPLPTLARPALAPDCDNPPNEIVAENCLTGNPASEWDVSGAGDASIQGFATDISVNRGGTVQFKIDTTAAAYEIRIYRLGYYGGNGARLIDTIPSTAVTATNQPACTFDAANRNLLDCGNWSVSANWTVPVNATSGVYIARPTRTDNGGASHIVFIVRDDASHSDLLFQTSDTTWQSYNTYGGYNAYGSSGATMAEKLSYNRPFTTRGAELENWLFNAEYPMIRWLERNGYDISYMSAIDIERYSSLIVNHKIYLSVGHDEYWSQGRRDAVTAARDAGVHLAFFSGNEIYWKIRWEDSGGQNYRTQVTYKEGSAAPSGSAEHRNCYNNYDCDPSPIWTGLWREASRENAHFTPENSLSGQISWRLNTGPITVPSEYAPLRFWRNTQVASLTPGGQVTLSDGTLGYEWDPEYPQYADWYPAGRILLSTTDVNSFVGPEQHHLSLYRASSGALVFGAGTVQWSWGLDGNHDRGTSIEDPNIQQATVNLFADMGVQPGSLQDGLVAVAASSDTIPPIVTVTSPTSGSSVPGGAVTITGTASDVGGVVGVVEVSTNGGTTWRRASGRENWSYSYSAAAGTADIHVRAADDSVNLSSPITHSFNVAPRTCPCSLWDPANPAGPEDSDTGAIEVGVKFRSDVSGWVTAIRYYKHATNTGAHIGNLWDMSGNNLGSVIFSGETSSGWQEATFNTPIQISADTTYIASYFTYGHYAASAGFFASSDVDNPPLHALQNGVDGPNGVYIYSASSAFPTQTWNSANYWVDLVFVTEVGPDNAPPHVSSTTPVSNATGVALNSTVTATFNEAMDSATVISSTFALRDASSNLIPATISYSSANRRATLTPNTALAPSTVYTATVKGGTSGVADVAGNRLATDYVWSFTTAAPPPLPPDEGPGGPILVIADASNLSNLFGRYYAEILRAEGFNAYTVTDISTVTAAALAAYDVVLLGEMSLTTNQITLLDDWVAGGGNLIAFRPAKALAALYGLTDANGTTSEGYLAVNTGTSIGRGVAGDTLQLHGTADHYTLSGATSLATLYTNATTPTTYPAIVRSSRGSGQVVIFTFDLARSIVLMRQGNPDWAGLEGDGTTGIRASDMFVGRSGQPNWIDNTKLLIPQADEQMHVLSHAIEQLNAAQLPLPRLWYFPNRLKGALIMTGDSEACSGSCVNVPMQHIQSYGGNYTAYLLGTQPTAAEVNGWLAAGSGVAPHYDDTAEASNPTYANMNAVYDTMTQNHIAAYGVAPRTVRNHWIVWTGWSEQAEIEAAHGIGLDTNYYHWGSWLGGPGFFTGSGLPLRFSDENGHILDIFQATTQLPDETWGQNIDTTFRTLIDRSIDQGYYGFLTANFHPPSYGSYQTVAGNLMSYANSRGVPIWSAEKLLDFLQARNQARTENIAWNGTQLTFAFNALIPYNGLTLMIPARAGGNDLLSITSGATPLSFTVETIKGYDYALFAASNGTYTASYEPDTIAPTITGRTPAASATNVAVNTNVTVTFDEAMNAATIHGTTFRLRADGASNDVAAVVSYNEGSLAATLNPNADLAYSTLYHVTVAGTVGDLANNPLGSDQTWSFTTQPVPPPSVTDTTVVDFSAGTLNACAVDATIGDGALRLGAAIDETFSGTALPAGWSSHAWSGGVPTVDGGLLTVNGAYARNDTLYGPGQTLEFVASFNADAYQHIGFGANEPTFNNGPWIMFSTGNSGTQLYARIVASASGPYNTGDDAIGLGSQYLGSAHQYRIVWNSNSIELYIDGAQVVTRNLTISDSMRVAINDYQNNGISLTADWLRMSPPYASPCTFTSRVFNAGGTVTWETLSWTGTTSAETSLGLSYRTGDTPVPNGTWTNFTTVPSSDAALSGSSRYIQYQANLSASDTNQTPILEDVTITHSIAVPDTTPPTVIGRTPVPNAVDVTLNTNVTVTFDEAMDAASFNTSAFTLVADGTVSPVPAAITYDPASRTATLNPTADLAYTTLYHVTVSGTVHDISNNALGNHDAWSFTTATAPLPVMADTTVADFSAGTLNSCVADSAIGDGAVRLLAAIDEGFSGSGLPTGWGYYDWPYDGRTGVYNVLGGLVTVDGIRVNPDPSAYTVDRILEFYATFTATPNQHIGFGAGNHNPPDDIFNTTPWAIFSTGSGGTALQARTWSGAGNLDYTIPGNWLGTPHLYRIEWTATNVVYFIDGQQVASQAYSSATTMRPTISDLTQDGSVLAVDWMRLTPYASLCSFESRVLDAGAPANWGTLAWTGSTPAGTNLALSYRIGNTSTPDGSWTSFVPVASSSTALAGNSRYIQYRATLTTGDPGQTPVLNDVTITYALGNETTPPTVTGRSPAPNATDVTVSSNVSVTFSELIDAATMTNSSLGLRQVGAGSDVPAAVTLAGNIATLDPSADLSPLTTYQMTVAASVADLVGNTLGADDTWTFTTGAVILSATDTTVADFSAGSLGACVVYATIGDGTVRLPLTIDEGFSGTGVPTGWSSGIWNSGGTATVSGDALTVDGARGYSNLSFGPGSSLEFRATFSAAHFQNVGFASSGDFGVPWIVIGEGSSSDGVYARTDTGTSILLSTTTLGAPHVYRIEWTASGFAFYVDGTLATTIVRSVASNMVVMISDFDTGGGTLTVDWVRATPYVSPCTFTSRVIDAGQPAHWLDLSRVGATPTSTSVSFETRTGNTAAPDGSWSGWQGTTGTIASPNGQYIQYRASLATTDAAQTPVIESVTLTYSAVITPVITWSNPANITYGTALGGTQLNATASTPGAFVYTPAVGTVLSAGTHTLHVDFTPTDTVNFSSASADVTINVNKATAAIALGSLSHIYDGTPKSANATTAPPGLTVIFTYDDLPTAPTNAGSYAVVATITDPNYEGTASGTFVILAKHSLSLMQGWNLVSFSPIPENDAITSVLAGLGSNYDLVYAWDAAAQGWLKYDRNAPAYVNTLTTLHRDRGFWLHATSAATLEVVGSVPTLTDITLAAGWNLVGYPSAVDRALPDALSDHGVGTNFSLVYAYHANDADPWKLFDHNGPPFVNDLTELTPGWGYWIQTTITGTWTVTYTGP